MTRETRHRSKHCDAHIFTCNRITHGDLAGGYVCDALVHGRYVHMRYLYYSKKEAVARFKEYLKDEAGKIIIK